MSMLQGDEEQSALARVPFDSEISISLQFRTPAQKKFGRSADARTVRGFKFFWLSMRPLHVGGKIIESEARMITHASEPSASCVQYINTVCKNTSRYYSAMPSEKAIAASWLRLTHAGPGLLGSCVGLFLARSSREHDPISRLSRNPDTAIGRTVKIY